MGLRVAPWKVFASSLLSAALFLGSVGAGTFAPAAAKPVVSNPRILPPPAPLPEASSTAWAQSAMASSPSVVPEDSEDAPDPDSAAVSQVSPPNSITITTDIAGNVVEEKPVPPKPPVQIPTYFVNREVQSSNIQMFPRWTGMLDRTNAEAHTLDNICGPAQHTPCKLREWKDFLESLKSRPVLEKIRAVNEFLNHYPYIEDVANYWKTPYEFQRLSGNCKDYAIAKFMSLRALGLSNDVMRITVLRDLNLGGIIHAILVVSVDGKTYILDNQIKQVVSTDKVYHYVPIYSINEEHWWQHFMLDSKGLS